jgi:hypothetical protein
MSVAANIAEAVVAELNGATLSQPITAARSYLPEFDLPEMADLHVTVVPRAMTKAPIGRSIMSAEIQVDIGVQKKLAAQGNAEIDALLGLVEEIAEFFEQRHLTAIPEAVWVKTEHKPLYAAEHMDEMRQFTSVVTLTFRLAH